MTGLASLREQLDAADDRILEAIAARCAVIRAIAEYKRAHGVPMSHPDRINYVRGRYRRFAECIPADAERFERVAAELIEVACELETELMAEDTPRAEV